MTTGNWSSRIRGYGTLALMVTVTMLGMSLFVEAQQVLERQPPNNDEVWKVNVTSALLPGKMEGKLRAKIEADRLACRSVDSTILEIPLTAITRITRDSGKDYPVAEFLMGVATHPSNERHTFGTKEYRKEMAGRAMLVAFAFVGLLFPKHKEVVLVSWKDESGEHDAEFRLGRTQGRTMLKKLQQETGLEPRDLEKERRDIEKGKKELRRWMKKKSEHPTKEPSGWPGRYIRQTICSGPLVLGAMGATPSITTSTRNKWQSGRWAANGATALEASMYSIPLAETS